jgi:hypothetical protein
MAAVLPSCFPRQILMSALRQVRGASGNGLTGVSDSKEAA